MKNIIISILFAALTLTSCNETDWLKENPLDFYAPENSYTTTAQFRQSLNFLYDNYRNLIWNTNEDFRTALYCTDIAHGGYDYPDLKYNNYAGYITPDAFVPRMLWTICYTGIGNANVIISQLELTDQVSDADKASFKGEALFFRALYYRILAHIYGGVPLTIEPITTPKRDFVRASRQEVYDQCRLDLEEASTLLNNIEATKDGMINKQVAQHLLSEIYISLGRHTDAIQAATAVISHSSMSLMTQRFGSRANEAGDVYWDLFRMNNQNRESSGNKESLWVLQYDYQNPGSSYPCQFSRQIIPGYWSVSVEGVTEGTTVPAFTTWTAEKGGRGIGSIQCTSYFFNEVWGDDFDTDIRNSTYNITRDWKIDNPNAKGFGEWFVKDGWLKESDKIRMFFPFIMKFSPVNNYPDESYAKQNDGSLSLTALGEHALLNSNGLAHGSFKDEYAFRLAETYLLRAEAYLGNNQKDKATDDINVVRSRAHASPVTAAEVDIDYILDERLRELYIEEVRIITLNRLGKTVERMRKYNPTGYNIADHQTLWPIPYSEIEKNIFNKIEQNPGY
jgi:hypothetical protein